MMLNGTALNTRSIKEMLYKKQSQKLEGEYEKTKDTKNIIAVG